MSMGICRCIVSIWCICAHYIYVYECSRRNKATEEWLVYHQRGRGQPESPRCDVQLPSLFHPGRVYLSSEQGFFAPTQLPQLLVLLVFVSLLVDCLVSWYLFLGAASDSWLTFACEQPMCFTSNCNVYDGSRPRPIQNPVSGQKWCTSRMSLVFPIENNRFAKTLPPSPQHCLEPVARTPTIQVDQLAGLVLSLWSHAQLEKQKDPDPLMIPWWSCIFNLQLKQVLCSGGHWHTHTNKQ